MKKAIKQKLPRGWTEKKVRDLIAYYDQQTDDEGAAEIDAAPIAPGLTWMTVPTELVQAVTSLIDAHNNKAPTSSLKLRSNKRQKSPGG